MVSSGTPTSSTGVGGTSGSSLSNSAPARLGAFGKELARSKSSTSPSAGIGKESVVSRKSSSSASCWRPWLPRLLCQDQNRGPPDRSSRPSLLPAPRHPTAAVVCACAGNASGSAGLTSVSSWAGSAEGAAERIAPDDHRLFVRQLKGSSFLSTGRSMAMVFSPGSRPSSPAGRESIAAGAGSAWRSRTKQGVSGIELEAHLGRFFPLAADAAGSVEQLRRQCIEMA
jgi:hypothetical protein